MAVKKGLPLWLAITLFLLLAGLLATAMLTELSRVHENHATQHRHAVKPEKPPVSQHPVRAHVANKPAAVTHAPKHPTTTPLDKPRPTPWPNAGIALIIDDAGYDLPALRRLIKLDIPLTVSVIPDAPYARQAARIAHKAGRMVMLHLPMQPVSEKYSRTMTTAFLHVGMNRQQLRDTFLKDLAMVPYARGVNNHMGSALTQLEQPMRWVMQLCLEQGLFFVDSKTSPHSVADKLAEEVGLERASRQFFLDHDLKPEALKLAWEKVRKCGREGRSCIIIGHPHRETVKFLEHALSDEDRAMLVPLNGLLQPATGLALQLQQSLATAQP